MFVKSHLDEVCQQIGIVILHVLSSSPEWVCWTLKTLYIANKINKVTERDNHILDILSAKYTQQI